MAGCGCVGDCDCFIEGSGIVSVTGSGDVTDPYVVNATETEFDLTSLSSVLQVTPDGPNGHTPSIDFILDPDSEAPVSIGPAGLRIDCCELDPGEAIISADACNDITNPGDGLYGDSGPTVVDPGGVTTRTLPAAGATTNVSWSRTITNNEDCDVLCHVGGNPVVIAYSNAGGISLYLDIAFRMNVVGGGTWLGGGTQRSVRKWIREDGGAIPAAGEIYSTADQVHDWLLVPAGASRTVETVLAMTRRQNLRGDSTFEFQTPHITAFRVRRNALAVVGSG